MPDRPAPTTRTSRCSRSLMSGNRARARADQPVVERTGVAEQLLAPQLDQLVGVAVVGMEVGPVVIAQLAPHLLLHEGRGAQVAEALAQLAAAVRLAVHGER